jgi:flagellar FliL protein
MSMPRVILLMLILNVAISLAGFAVTYSLLKARPVATAGAAAGEAQVSVDEAEVELTEYTFFPIEKIIVSLQGDGREHYFVLDLVLQADVEADVKKLGQIDPMVRTSVVAHLSRMSFSELRGMPISELQALLEAALQADFASKKLVQPFAHVLVSKLIVQ